MFSGKGTFGWPAAGYNHSIPRNNYRTFARLPQNLFSNQVEYGCGARNNGPGTNHRTTFYDGSLIDSAVTTNQDIIFNDDRQRTNRFKNPSDLATRAEMHALPDLSAGPNQGMRIHHSFVVNVSTHVEVGRRHQADILPQVGPPTYRRASWNKAKRVRNLPQVFQRISRFIQELKIVVQ